MILSLTPSLLPRGPLFQGIVSGAAGALGYMFGVFAVWLVRYMRSRDTSPPAPRWAWPALGVVALVSIIGGQYLFHVWQDDVRDLMGVPHLAWYNYPQAAALAVVVFLVLVAFGKSIRWAVRFLMIQLERIAPRRVSGVVAVGLVVALVISVINGVVARNVMSALNTTFDAVNNEDTTANGAPTTRCAPVVRNRR